MADISIKDLRKVMIRDDATPRERENDRRKARQFLDDNVRIVEKIDGTKLTLIRRNNEFDPNDYAKNWHVAYRGNLIFPSEIRGLGKREEEIRAHSAGTAQYALVHSLLERMHHQTAEIPQGTEFFLEFVQRKATITRDYPQKHGIFLTLFGPCHYKLTGTHLVSNMTPVDDDDMLERYARLLGVKTYPVMFDGKLSSINDFRAGIRNKAIERRFNEVFSSLNDAYNDRSPDRPLRIIDVIYKVFSEFKTSLSTETDLSPAEGVVMRTSTTRALYKALNPDQHDETTRGAVKDKFRETPPIEQAYWSSIITIADEIVAEFAPAQNRNIKESEMNDLLERIHNECYFDAAISNRLGRLFHRKKELIQRQEDLFLTTKTRIMKRVEIGDRNGITVGIFVLAGKPVHDGHWKMIGRVASECDEALIITSIAGRDELPAGVMIDAWKSVLEPQFHKDFPNATLIISQESPLDIAVNKMRDLKGIVSRFIFYSDVEDAKVKYSPAKMRSTIKDPAVLEKFQQVAVPRSETTQISGTMMRGFIAAGDKSSFDSYVPKNLNQEMKNMYWGIVKGERGDIQDGRRILLKSLLEHILVDR
jgi:hypothetical protein